MKHRLRFRWLSNLTVAVGILVLGFGCSSPEGPVEVADVNGVKNLNQDGRIYIAGTPSPDGLDELKSRGVKTVIDLRRPEELSGGEAEAARQRGITYFHLPMQSDQVTEEQAARFMKIMRENESEPVLLHCAGGNRAGAMYGLYLGASGQCPLDEAIKRAKAAGLRNEKLEKDVEQALLSTTQQD